MADPPRHPKETRSCAMLGSSAIVILAKSWSSSTPLLINHFGQDVIVIVSASCHLSNGCMFPFVDATHERVQYPIVSLRFSPADPKSSSVAPWLKGLESILVGLFKYPTLAAMFF